MVEESSLIVLRSTYGKTPSIQYVIEPCRDPKTNRYADCVRKVNSSGDMILSDDDIKKQSSGKAVFIPENMKIYVEDGTTFDLNDIAQAAQWNAIKYSKLIAKEIDEKDAAGKSVIEGGLLFVDYSKSYFGNARGTYGLAELFIERPGKAATIKNNTRKLINKAQNLVFNDDLAHRVLISKLFGKDFEHTTPSDVEDFLLTKAEKEPEKIIEYYDVKKSGIRLLLIVAQERKVVTKENDGLYYGSIRLGSNMDIASEFLQNESNKDIKEMLSKETYPELQVLNPNLKK